MAKGYIPTSVEYFCRKSKKIKITWDASWNVKDKDVIWEGDAIPTFPIPGDATDKRRQTAKDWASSRDWWTANRGVNSPPHTPDEYKFDNKPFSVVVCSLEHRGHGGRAYKVMTEEGFYFDLREDVLLEALLECGCQPGGFLGGKFLWMMAHNNMKLIRDGSQLHEDMIAATFRRNSDPIPNDELVTGEIYSGKDSLDKVIFLGEVIVNAGKPKLLFFPLDLYDKLSPQDQFDNYQKPVHTGTLGNNNAVDFYRYMFKLSHKYVVKEGDIVLPLNHIDVLRQAALEEMRKRIDENYAMRGHNPNVKDCLKFFRHLVHMHRIGEEMPVIPEFAPKRRTKAK